MEQHACSWPHVAMSLCADAPPKNSYYYYHIHMCSCSARPNLRAHTLSTTPSSRPANHLSPPTRTSYIVQNAMHKFIMINEMKNKTQERHSSSSNNNNTGGQRERRQQQQWRQQQLFHFYNKQRERERENEGKKCIRSKYLYSICRPAHVNVFM